MPETEQSAERSHDQDFIDAVESQSFTTALREIGASPITIRCAAHGILDRALDEMGIPREDPPAKVYTFSAPALAVPGWIRRRVAARRAELVSNENHGD